MKLVYLLFVKFGRRTIQKSSKIINDEQNRIVLNLQNGETKEMKFKQAEPLISSGA